ncbi:MAG: hypothetical protein KAJ75_06575 [Alphaproteobacteria bacterium]|nr:hypothetical protein [Alphaproteobacteria bacterium]
MSDAQKLIDTFSKNKNVKTYTGGTSGVAVNVLKKEKTLTSRIDDFVKSKPFIASTVAAVGKALVSRGISDMEKDHSKGTIEMAVGIILMEAGGSNTIEEINDIENLKKYEKSVDRAVKIGSKAIEVGSKTVEIKDKIDNKVQKIKNVFFGKKKQGR